MDKKQHRKRKKFKRLVIAYLLRAVVILIPLIVIILMVCNTNTYRDTNTDNGAAPITPTAEYVSKFCVIIDAGHGGSDGGTVSGKIIEKDINLSVALKLKTILEDNNIEVILTRNSDEKMSLAQRTSVANDSNADVFISLHCNYYEDDEQIAGLECYYNSADATESKAYAESIIHAVSLSNDVKTRYAKTENYYVLRNTQIPAVLVEMGFLSNYSESQKLLNDDYQEILAQRMAEGIFNKIKGD